MRRLHYKDVVEKVAEMCKDATTELTDDVITAYEKARETEESPLGREVMERIIENAKIAKNLRNRLNSAINNGQKPGSSVKDLGCSIEELKQHLESQFYNRFTGERMTWDNYGYYGWHIDHIKPLSSFDLADHKQFLEACHYTNLQPLWAEDNFEKNAKIR